MSVLIPKCIHKLTSDSQSVSNFVKHQRLSTAHFARVVASVGNTRVYQKHTITQKRIKIEPPRFVHVYHIFGIKCDFAKNH